MAIRFTFCLLFACWMSMAGSAFAQSVPFWGQDQSFMGGAQPGGATPAGYSQGGGYDSVVPGPPNAPPGAGLNPYAQPNPYANAAFQRQQGPPLPNDLFVPDQNIIPRDDPSDRALGKFFKAVFDEPWIRIEGLAWTVDKPGNQLLGAQFNTATGVTDVRNYFPVFDGMANPIGFARVLDLSQINFKDTAGIRGTMGARTDFGSFEVNAWGITDARQSISDPNIPQAGFFTATTTTTNGLPSNVAFLWDVSFTANYSSDIWGTELKFRLDTPGEWPAGMIVEPLFGLQLTKVDEQLNQVGQFNNQGTQPIRTGIIDSNMNNTLIGPTLGLHLEFETERFTFGAEPKVFMAGNFLSGSVNTFNLRSAADGLDVENADDLTFAPVLSVNAFARLKLTERVWLFANWDVMWLTHIARAGSSIDYNDNVTITNPNAPPDIGYLKSYNGMTLSGASAGLEIELW